MPYVPGAALLIAYEAEEKSREVRFKSDDPANCDHIFFNYEKDKCYGCGKKLEEIRNG